MNNNKVFNEMMNSINKGIAHENNIYDLVCEGGDIEAYENSDDYDPEEFAFLNDIEDELECEDDECDEDDIDISALIDDDDSDDDEFDDDVENLGDDDDDVSDEDDIDISDLF